MSFRFEKDWFKIFTKILKRRARHKKELSAKLRAVSIKVVINVLNF